MADPPDSPASGRTIDFERGIPFLVAALGNKLSAVASRDVRLELGIGLMEWRILALLAVEAEATPARIAQVAGVDKSVVSRGVGSLEERDLIKVAAGSRGRQTRLALTAQGERLHDRGIALSYERNDALLDGFTSEEQTQLADLLVRATANLPKLERKSEA